MNAYGVTVVFSHISITPDLARKAEKTGADIIVAKGMDEGGTLPSHNMEHFLLFHLLLIQ